MAKLKGNTIQYSVYDRTKGKAKKVADTTTYTRPPIEKMTETFAGSAVPGEIDLPAYLALNSMEGAMGFTQSNDDVVELFTPVAHKIEVRWVAETLNSATGNMEICAYKELITMLPKAMDLGELENNTANENELTYEVLAYELIIEGKSKIKIDKLNNVLKINGTDYASKVRNAL